MRIMLPDDAEVDIPDETEWFEYPTAWEEAYRAKRGNRQYLAQYALMELLRQRYGIQSLT